jgi:hypothetical protein|tara:strand:+ start:331 stop:603 length:273 start_codon:yes stop_codon:yes gene_type:complete
MGSELYCILNAVIFSIIINITLPMLLSPYATIEEKMPPAGAASLTAKGQLMHMMVHHEQVLVTSSVLVGVIVGLSVYLGYCFKPMEALMK